MELRIEVSKDGHGGIMKPIMKPNRWSNYQFKNGKIAKNRVVVPPMASQTADSSGFVTEKTIQHYKQLSNSGAGIIFAEYSYIHLSGKGEPNQLGVDDDSKVAGLKRISHVINQSGALAGHQIVHVGGKTSSTLTGSPLLGPSPIAVPIKDRELEAPLAMDKVQIEEMIDWYIQAAKRSEIAGFDIVELHAAHGYGLNQWLSPITNQRDDEFGGDISGRSNLLIQVAAKIKKYLPNLLISVRMPAQDYFPEGLQPEEMSWVARKLESIGIDLIDVSSGIGGWRRQQGIEGQGYLISDAALIKQTVSLPVIGVGGIQDGDFIDAILGESQVDFAAVGRAILEGPVQWKQNNLEPSSTLHKTDGLDI